MTDGTPFTNLETRQLLARIRSSKKLRKELQDRAMRIWQGALRIDDTVYDLSLAYAELERDLEFENMGKILNYYPQRPNWWEIVARTMMEIRREV